MYLDMMIHIPTSHAGQGREEEWWLFRQGGGVGSLHTRDGNENGILQLIPISVPSTCRIVPVSPTNECFI